MEERRPNVLSYATPPATEPLVDPWVALCLAASLWVSPAMLGTWLMPRIGDALFGVFGRWTNMAGALSLPVVCLIVSVAVHSRTRRRGGSESNIFLGLLAVVVNVLSILFYPVLGFLA